MGALTEECESPCTLALVFLQRAALAPCVLTFSAVFQVWRPQPVLGSDWLLAIDSPIGLDWAGQSGVGSALRASRVWLARPPAAKRATGAVVSLRYFCAHKDLLLACALLAPSQGSLVALVRVSWPGL